MMMRFSARGWLPLFILLAGMSFVNGAEATHARYGHISWEPRPDIGENTVDFRIIVAFRRSYFGSLEIGSTFRPAGIRFGDGQTKLLWFEVIAVNIQEDWVVARALESGMDPGFVRHTYVTPVRSNGEPWEVRVELCCRIRSLRNSAGSSFGFFAEVDLSNSNHSPVSSLPPIVTCARGECQFSVPALDRDGDSLRWSLTPLNRSGIRRNPEGLILDSDTGFIDWSDGSANALLGLYALSVMIEDIDEQGQPRSAVVVDFIINLRDFVDNQPPKFDRPPSPVSGETINVIVGQPFVMDIQASDPDLEDEVFLNNLGLPSGAGFEIISQGNPTVAEFTWAPEMKDIGQHLVTFTATDQKAASALPLSVMLRVIQPIISDVRLIDRVSTDRVAVEESTFSVQPADIRMEGGLTFIEWQYPTFDAGQSENIHFDVRLTDLQPGETRLVIHDLLLEYLDVNGNRVSEALGSRAVQVAESVLAIATSTDRIQYRPAETVQIATQVDNLDDIPAAANVRLRIEDAAGVLVAELGASALALDAGAGQMLASSFAVGSTVAGGYRVIAELLNDAGRVVDRAEALFSVVTESGGPLMAASAITTDRPRYGRWDTVRLQARLQNTASNAALPATRNTLRVIAPDGETLLLEDRDLASLAATAIEDFDFTLPLSDDPAGTWQVTWTTRDAFSNEVLAASQTDFIVEHIALQQLRGEASVAQARIFHTADNQCLYQVSNRAPETVADIEIAHSLVHVESEALVSRAIRTIGRLESEEADQWSEAFSAIDRPYGGYACILEARIGGEWQVIASTAFEVLAPRIATTLDTGDRGRVLVLADRPRECSALEDIRIGLDFEAGLATASRIDVRLLDEDGNLLDIERVTGFGQWINTGSSTGTADLAVSATVEGEFELAISVPGGKLLPAHEVEIVVTRGWLLRSSKRWRIDTSCDRPFTLGELFEDIRLLAWRPWQGSDDLRDADPFGPLASLSVTRQTEFLETLLAGTGWEYTLVHDAKDFTREHRLGGYGTYLLLSERPMLPRKVQKEVREAVYAGAGLIVAGAHDRRNLWLDEPLGIQIVGRHPWARGVQLHESDLGTGWSADLPITDKVLGIKLRGAEVLAEYHLQGDDGHSLWYWLDKSSFGLLDISRFKRRAITRHQYGDGTGLFFGFDLLLQAAEAGEQSVYADLLRNSLQLAHPDQRRTGVEDVLPLSISLSNLRGATTGRVWLRLPADAEVEVAGSFAQHDQGWLFDVGLGEGQRLDEHAYVRLPSEPGLHTFRLDVATDIDGFYLQQHSAELKMNVLARSEPGDTRLLLDQLAWRYWYRPAYRSAWLKFGLAMEAMNNGYWHLAQEKLLVSAALLGADLEADVLTARQEIGTHIRYVARQLVDVE